MLYSKLKAILLTLTILLCPAYSGFPYDKNSKNIAVLFTMTDEGGRIENLDKMESVFKDGKLGFEYQRHHNKSSTYIYETLTKTSKEVGKYGTLLVYLNSHGGNIKGEFGMSAREGAFRLSKALEAIAKGGKVKRLIVLIDTCHASGGIVEGFNGDQKPIDPKVGLPKLRAYFKLDYTNACDEALVIASSSVKDLSMRGHFAARLKKAYESVKNDATVAEFLQSFAALHSNTNQKPYYKALPNESLLNEPLFLNALIRRIPIKDYDTPQRKFSPDYIPIPSK